MAIRTMRAVQEGEVPLDGGTAVQENPDRPVLPAAACWPPGWIPST